MISFHKKILSDKKFILGCSGGVDSIACATFLKNGKYDFALFHFNHKLRPQNDLMQSYVEKFANFINVPLYIYTAEEYPIRKGNLESCAREARLKAIGDLPFDYQNVVLCHHLNDAIESYLMKCFCGTLQDNFLPVRTNLNNGKTLLRPFLLTPKDEFIHYLIRKKMENFVVEDETNTDRKIRRNFIRHEVIPVVTEQYKGLRKVVLKKLIKQYARDTEFQNPSQDNSLIN